MNTYTIGDDIELSIILTLNGAVDKALVGSTIRAGLVGSEGLSTAVGILIGTPNVDRAGATFVIPASLSNQLTPGLYDLEVQKFDLSGHRTTFDRTRMNFISSDLDIPAPTPVGGFDFSSPINSGLISLLRSF